MAAGSDCKTQWFALFACIKAQQNTTGLRIGRISSGSQQSGRLVFNLQLDILGKRMTFASLFSQKIGK